eukprot:1137524-Pelagomonas_calceolata.AAC.1
MEIRRVTSSSSSLILVMRVEKGLLKSASGANNFISILERVSMKLQSKLDGCMRVKIKFLRKNGEGQGMETHIRGKKRQE